MDFNVIYDSGFLMKFDFFIIVLFALLFLLLIKTRGFNVESPSGG